MSCICSMLQDAKIHNVDGEDVGEVVSFHVGAGKLWLTVDFGDDEEGDEEDPDGGTRVPAPEEIVRPKIRAIAGGKTGG